MGSVCLTRTSRIGIGWLKLFLSLIHRLSYSHGCTPHDILICLSMYLFIYLILLICIFNSESIYVFCSLGVSCLFASYEGMTTLEKEMKTLTTLILIDSWLAIIWWWIDGNWIQDLRPNQISSSHYVIYTNWLVMLLNNLNYI